MVCLRRCKVTLVAFIQPFAVVRYQMSPQHVCTIDRVVVRSRSQIVKPDELFVVFLGIKWAHDIVNKIDHEFMGIFGPEIFVILGCFPP